MDKKLNEQETFWKSEFGDDYILRNSLNENLEMRTAEFRKFFLSVNEIDSVLEFGTNVGTNLEVIKSFFPNAELHGNEINENAIKELAKVIPDKNIHKGSMVDLEINQQFDLVMTRGVLIHLNPNDLNNAYNQLYKYSKKYILIVEYFSKQPAEIEYRGNKNKLFKRDFCRELLDNYNDLKLVDYGFLYSSDNQFSFDDNNWFLLEKVY